MSGIKQLVRRVRKTGLFHKIGYARVAVRCWLHPPPPRGSFPPARKAVKKPAGLVAIGGTLAPEALLEAHRKGIYPMYYEKPVKWFAPDPRVVLFLENMRIERRGLRKLARSGRYHVTFDTCFDEVLGQCGNRESTWLTKEVVETYVELHRRGHAHSVEVWDEEGALIGGLYGMASGRIFSTDSAFQHARDAIRIAFMHLNCHLQHWGFVLNDMQMPSGLADALGCESISRKRYSALLDEYASAESRIGPWHIDDVLDVADWIPSEPGSQLRKPDQ